MSEEKDLLITWLFVGGIVLALLFGCAYAIARWRKRREEQQQRLKQRQRQFNAGRAKDETAEVYGVPQEDIPLQSTNPQSPDNTPSKDLCSSEGAVPQPKAPDSRKFDKEEKQLVIPGDTVSCPEDSGLLPPSLPVKADKQPFPTQNSLLVKAQVTAPPEKEAKRQCASGKIQQVLVIMEPMEPRSSSTEQLIYTTHRPEKTSKQLCVGSKQLRVGTADGLEGVYNPSCSPSSSTKLTGPDNSPPLDTSFPGEVPIVPFKTTGPSSSIEDANVAAKKSTTTNTQTPTEMTCEASL